jgi:uncharacterized protein (TIGR02217 family)
MTAPYMPSRWAVLAADATSSDSDIYPFLPGQSFLVSKRPQWSTKIATAASGRERRRKIWSYPRWSFEVSYEVLRDTPANDELHILLAFFNAHAGMYQEFFFLDADDNTVVAQPFGAGDGVTTTFQLTRTLAHGGITFTEPVTGLLGVPTVFVGAASVAAFTAGPYGLITFASPPAAGTALTWTGRFMFACRFEKDDLNLKQMMKALWSQAGVTFISVKR